MRVTLCDRCECRIGKGGKGKGSKEISYYRFDEYNVKIEVCADLCAGCAAAFEDFLGNRHVAPAPKFS